MSDVPEKQTDSEFKAYPSDRVIGTILHAHGGQYIHYYGPSTIQDL